MTRSVQIFKSVGLLATLTAVNLWLPEWIPFDKLPITQFWQVLLLRIVMSLISIAAMKMWFPSSLQRLKVKWGRRRIFVALGIIAFLIAPSLTPSQFSGFSISQVIEGITFALFIGVDEELFSRGFVFAALEEYGIHLAAVMSSIQFGLLHFTNLFWGGQSISYTLGQVLSASSFGFLCVGIMIYTKTIWFGVALHGLYDTPMQFQSSVNFTKLLTGSSDWLPLIIQALIYILAGWILIALNDQERVLKFMDKFGLIKEQEEPFIL